MGGYTYRYQNDPTFRWAVVYEILIYHNNNNICKTRTSNIEIGSTVQNSKLNYTHAETSQKSKQPTSLSLTDLPSHSLTHSRTHARTHARTSLKH